MPRQSASLSFCEGAQQKNVKTCGVQMRKREQKEGIIACAPPLNRLLPFPPEQTTRGRAYTLALYEHIHDAALWRPRGGAEAHTLEIEGAGCSSRSQ